MKDNRQEYIDTHSFCECHACRLVETRIGNVVRDIEVRNVVVPKDTEVADENTTTEEV